MESSKIPMLSRFDTISHIMPYFAHTHKAFLLLSSLCSATRGKLDEFYDEFITSMTEYWVILKWGFESNFDYLCLPNDLFEFFIECDSVEIIEALIRFIENLRDSQGWFFNKHYMHSKIKIRDPVAVDIDMINKLHPYADILKSTQIILCKKGLQNSKIQYQFTTLDTNYNYIIKQLWYCVHYIKCYIIWTWNLFNLLVSLLVDAILWSFD